MLGIQRALEKLHKVINRHALPFRHVAEIGPRGEENGRGEFRQQMIRQIKIEVETRKIALLLLFQFLYLELWKEHPALGMIWVRKREKARRPHVLLADLLRRHLAELGPRHALGQPNADARLHELTAGHLHAGRWVVAQVVAGGEEVGVLLVNRRLLGAHPRHRRLEIFLRHDRHETRWHGRLGIR